MSARQYADERAALIDLATTRDWGPGVHGDSHSTTHVTAADADGNVMTTTQTINGLFGACLQVPETGMIANNYMYNFDPHPGHALSVEPGKRVFTSMAPMMVCRDDEVRYALGLPGALRIFPSAFQALVNLIDHGMTLQEAVEAPRVWTEGGVLEIETTFPESVERALADRGHDVQRVGRIAGGMNAIAFEDDGSLTGAACWRADGTPVAIAGGPRPSGRPLLRVVGDRCRNTSWCSTPSGTTPPSGLAGTAPRRFRAHPRHRPSGDAHLARIIADADYAVSGQVAVSGDVLRAATRLKLLHKWGVGVDNLDVATAHELGIAVARTTGSNAVPVAEFTIGLMIGTLRHVAHGHHRLQGGEWRSGFDTAPLMLSGKTVGLIGFGAIGKNVARLLGGFGCDVAYHKPSRLTPGRGRDATRRPLRSTCPRCWQTSDVVSLHCPLTDATTADDRPGRADPHEAERRR